NDSYPSLAGGRAYAKSNPKTVFERSERAPFFVGDHSDLCRRVGIGRELVTGRYLVTIPIEIREDSPSVALVFEEGSQRVVAEVDATFEKLHVGLALEPARIFLGGDLRSV